ncbi:MAG TPA: DUF4386 domain-containing protein [Acidimicrobiia bacterium]|jgi:hypothetical protein|nr:DUF4386 domain-containing protein [Acidimicrobiia bacterium]
MDRKTRKLALAAGVLYLVTFVASIPTLGLKAPLVNHPEWILGHGSDTGVILACLMDFVCALAGVGTAIALFPVVRRLRPTAAIGFLASRTIEGVILVVGAISLLSIVTLRGSGGDTASMMTASRSLLAAHHWAFLFGPGTMPAINALFLATVMYRFRLAPRFIPLMGIVGAPLLLTSGLVTMFGGWSQSSSTALVFALPIAAWEFSIGVYMTVKGFKTSTDAVDVPFASPALAA